MSNVDRPAPAADARTNDPVAEPSVDIPADPPVDVPTRPLVDAVTDALTVAIAEAGVEADPEIIASATAAAVLEIVGPTMEPEPVRLPTIVIEPDGPSPRDRFRAMMDAWAVDVTLVAVTPRDEPSSRMAGRVATADIEGKRLRLLDEFGEIAFDLNVSDIETIRVW